MFSPPDDVRSLSDHLRSAIRDVSRHSFLQISNGIGGEKLAHGIAVVALTSGMTNLLKLLANSQIYCSAHYYQFAFCEIWTEL